MICSAVSLVRFMVESPAQSGRLRTLIHPGPVAGAHVTIAQVPPLQQQMDPQHRLQLVGCTATLAADPELVRFDQLNQRLQ